MYTNIIKNKGLQRGYRQIDEKVENRRRDRHETNSHYIQTAVLDKAVTGIKWEDKPD